jgi:Amt family ammonium transporter
MTITAANAAAPELMWMKRMGALDFAGGTVIHISSGAAALAAVMVIGKRRGYGRTRYIPHNLPMTLTGAALLWFGWFGFNAGSALACDGLAVHAFVATHLAASAAAMAWGFMEWKRDGKPTTLGVASGAVAGLVAITPACGFVGPLSALLIGMVAGGLCYYGIMMKARFGYDDALDVVGIHGLGGAWGALATGFFASKAINPGGNNGLFFGNPTQVLVQLVSVVVSVVFSFVMTFIILMIVERTVGLRLTAEEEEMGLDVALHSETGYNF